MSTYSCKTRIALTFEPVFENPVKNIKGIKTLHREFDTYFRLVEEQL